ncbi:MAG TPA: superoxide dismutase family protein [Thermoanaerobaculia bacterium]|nr:superoxide dismutase family protein [Thermoanaerobaculia bacterium]
MRTIARTFVALAPLAFLAACSGSKSSSPATTTPHAGPTAVATIEGRSGSSLTGTATFVQNGDAVHVSVDVSKAPQGVHAVHLHEKGDCSAPDATSAGGHFNPMHMEHGSPDAPVHHAGDFGNILVGEDGHGHLELDTAMLTVLPGDRSVAGRAVVVHAKEDDMHTQPTGNAGGRIGCGVVAEKTAASLK